MSRFGPDWFVKGGPKPTKEVPFDEPEDEESEGDGGDDYVCPSCGSAQYVFPNGDGMLCEACNYKGAKDDFTAKDKKPEEPEGACCFACGYEGEKDEFSSGTCPRCDSSNISVDDEPDDEPEDDEPEEDDFGNTGKKLYSVDVLFTERRSGTATMTVAADSPGEARDRAEAAIESGGVDDLRDEVDFGVDDYDTDIESVDEI